MRMNNFLLPAFQLSFIPHSGSEKWLISHPAKPYMLGPLYPGNLGPLDMRVSQRFLSLGADQKESELWAQNDQIYLVFTQVLPHFHVQTM